MVGSILIEPTQTGAPGSSAGTDGRGQQYPLKPESDIDVARVINGSRNSSAPERFSESKYSQWSAYDMDRRGERHEPTTRKAVEEACAAEPALAASLEELYSRLRAVASSAAATDPTSELVGEMERAAATALHAALVECLASAGMDEESIHI